MRPLISIIIPTLQEEDYLEKTLSNLTKNFNSPSHEIIISDGGSKDSTISIAKRYPVSVIENSTGKKQNISIGRNLGAKKAKGKFLVFLDSDVIIKNPQDFFNKVIEKFNDKNLVALTCNIRVLPEYEKVQDYLVFSNLNLFHRFMNNLLNKGRASGEFQAYRKEAFRKVKGYNENLPAGEDYDIFYRISKIGKVRMEKTLTVYHTGRRARKIGWIKLLLSWGINTLYWEIFNKGFHKSWKVVR